MTLCKLLELLRLGFEDEAEDEAIQRFLINAVARCHTTIVRDLLLGLGKRFVSLSDKSGAGWPDQPGSGIWYRWKKIEYLVGRQSVSRKIPRLRFGNDERSKFFSGNGWGFEASPVPRSVPD